MGASLRRAMQRWRSRLATKFVLLVAGLTALTLGATAWFSYAWYRDIYLANLRAKTEMLARFTASISPDRIFANDFSTLHNYVRELSREQDLLYAVVIAADGEPMTAYLKDGEPLVNDAARVVGRDNVLGVVNRLNRLPDVVPIEAPIRFGDQVLGKVAIGATRRYLEGDLRQVLLWSSAGGLLIVVLLSAGSYLIFRQSVLRPTLQIMRGAQRVAGGDLRAAIPVGTRDELGELAQAFNEMTANLARSDASRAQALEELRELNRTLESRVEERTRAIEAVNRQLEQLALYDPLTNLPNRTLLHDRLQQLLKAHERRQKSFVVMLMDLDRFKEVNDTLGHHAGDQLLQQVADRLRRVLHDGDTVARLGGDEFAVLLPDADLAGATAVAQRVLKAMEAAVDLEGLSYTIGASLGVAIYPEHGIDASMLLRHADVAMYEAKQNKTGYCLYHRTIDPHSPSRLALMNDLRLAIEGRELSLHYQTIVELATGRVRGVEALSRWHPAKRGHVPPDLFIPIIEQTGLLRPFSQWLLDTALEQWLLWHNAGLDAVVSINLSMRNLHDKDFPAQLAAALERREVAPHGLMLEITESSMLSDPDRVLRTLERFHALGVDVSIDDFGTGYSSLSTLRRLPVQEIKIDRSFVKDMVTNRDDAAIVRSTIDLAHNLGLRVVAEGVEDEETLALLHELGCDLVQGYYLGAPVAAEALTPLMTGGRQQQG